MRQRKKTTNQPAKLLDYANLLGQVKERIRHAQVRAVLSVNAELIRLYCDISRMIAFFRAHLRPAELLPQPVAKVVANEVSPQAVAKLKASAKVPQPVAQIPAADPVLCSVPWGHHALLLEKVNDLDHRL